MSIHAANPVAPPQLCLRVVELAVESLAACNAGDGARRHLPRKSGLLRPFLFILGSQVVSPAFTLTRFQL